jgi:molybdopterin molybdotransferase
MASRTCDPPAAVPVTPSAPLSVAQARDAVLAGVTRLPSRNVPISEVSGLVLAETVVAAEPVPRFANSAMDGYAVRAADCARVPARLQVIGTVAAGEGLASALSAGEAARIMTGAPLPAGADAVCMVEHTRAADGSLTVIIDEPVRPGANVRNPGEDIEAGSTVFVAGTRLGPAHVGVLASLGRATVLAHPRPAVGVLSTGDELAPDCCTPGPGKIRDANRPALLAQLACDRFQPIDLGLAGDNESAITGVLQAACRRCDMIIASGGVSVGDHDVLKVVLGRLGGPSMRSLHIAVKPGKHVALARLGARRVLTFGLPGNPVAALVAYELFARPALRAMAGHRVIERPRLSAIAETDLRRRPGPKLHLVRVTARADDAGNLRVRASGGQDSHMLRAMAMANALALLPDGDGVRAGERVEIMLLDPELS